LFLIVGTAFLALLSLTLIMLWGHERLSLKKFIPHAKVEEGWVGEERREHARFEDNIEVEYSIEKKPRLKNGKCVNISQGGMKLTLDEKLPLGSVIDLKIYSPEKKKTIEVEGEIVWTSESEGRDAQGKRFFHSGIKFICIKEPSEMRLSDYIASLGSGK
jgi:hypothetical protein